MLMEIYSQLMTVFVIEKRRNVERVQKFVDKGTLCVKILCVVFVVVEQPKKRMFIIS